MTEPEADIQPEGQAPRDRARSRQVELRIAGLATRQHGVVARRQLRAIGVGEGAIRHRLSLRRLHPVHRGVYAVGHHRLTARGRWMAATLGSGAGAVLSHGSAAALWGILHTASPRIHVTVPASSRRPRPGLTVHGGRLSAADRAVRDAIPVTSPARTLLDLAEVVSVDRLARAFEEADRLRILDLDALREVCERCKGRRGLKQLRPLLSSLSEAPHTRSGLERRFVAFCREHRLPAPVTNVPIGGFEVDAVWQSHRLVVELDGFEFHRTRAAFERDRARDIDLKLAGYDVLRVTARRLQREPTVVANAIRRILGRG